MARGVSFRKVRTLSEYAWYGIVFVMRIEFLPSGTVTSPKGFQAGAVYAGIKKKGDGDLGLLVSEAPCVAAGVFTTNLVKSAPVVLSQKRLQSGRARAVVVNSGCANASTGAQGLTDAAEMAELAAQVAGVPATDVLVASTGVIGQRLPMERLKTGMKRVRLSADGGHRLARAIMTTDTVPKETAVEADGFVIGGVAKGAGMICPNLATMLCFLSTDASVAPGFLQKALQRAVDLSFNMISVDGDTSPNDTVFLLANGLAGNKPIDERSAQAEVFQQALDQLCIHLAKAIARDGEGATKLIQVTVKGALTQADARLAARTVVSSPLVKTAVHGSDPNWGRILAAVGRSGAQLIESKIDLYLNGNCLVKGGTPQNFFRSRLVELLSEKEVFIGVDLNLGEAIATAWGCDLSEEYVIINSQYTT